MEQNKMESFQSMVEEYKPYGPWDLYAAICIKEKLKKMRSNPSDDFKCLALMTNPYDWQFAIRGPNGTEFEGGIYHGRIQFSNEYPDKPPIVTLSTENGRFKTQTEISFSHNFWDQFEVRKALLGLIELLHTNPDGALGSVEYNKKKRRALAIKSRVAAPIYGTAERQKLIDELQYLHKIHAYMFSKALPLTSNRGGDIQASYQLQAGIFDFENNCSKKAKQVVSSRETSSTSREDNQE